MQYFAKVLNGVVTDVIAADSEYFGSFVDSSPGLWLETSIDARGGRRYDPDSGGDVTGLMPAQRGNYAGVGYLYDSVNDVFYPPQPFASWTIGAPTWQWQAPKPMPAEDNRYAWDESVADWVAQ